MQVDPSKPPAYVPAGPAHAETDEGLVSEAAVAERLGVEPTDLSWVPYAGSGILFMSRSAQLDDEAPLNSSAMMIMKKMGLEAFARMAIRGPAVVFPGGPPWGPLEGDLRHEGAA